MHRKHGYCGTPTYKTWQAMKGRCAGRLSDPARYKDRGIAVCERWLKFENFLADMGNRPSGMTIDRIDSDGNYEPSNCRWATKREQMQNTSYNVFLELDGKRRCVAEWSRITGLQKQTIRKRLLLGWPVRDVLKATKNFRYVYRAATA